VQATYIRPRYLPQLQNSAASQKQYSLQNFADTALKASAGLWFLVAVIGQWAFLYYIVAFYGPSTLQGHFQAWSKNTFLFKGYVAGDTAGNLAFAAHALLAAVIAFGGALQLIPQIRARAISVHRWNGRLFLLTALAVSIAGLYLVWVRGAPSQTLSARSPSASTLCSSSSSPVWPGARHSGVRSLPIAAGRCAPISWRMRNGSRVSAFSPGSSSIGGRSE